MIVAALMAVLALLALALLTRPWWSAAVTATMQRRAANVAAYRTRLAELDNDRASGLIDAESAQAMKQELDAHLLQDAAPADADASVQSGARWPAYVLLLLLPLAAGAWYALAGSWRTQQMIDIAAADPVAGQQLAVQAMVDGLSERLQHNPDDAEGWAMLGRSYFVLGRFAESAQAYASANRLGETPSPAWLIGEAEALTYVNERNLQGRPRELFEAALKLDPADGRALWYAGLAALQASDHVVAQKHWAALSQRPDLPGEMREVLQVRLKELSQLTGQPLPAAPTGVSLEVEVTLAPALKDQLPGATLFVFAKAQNGPPMPLAVQRLTNAKLPMTLKLDDSMAMMPQLRLSQFDRWVVTARLTRGGTVTAESGDLEGQVELGKADAGKPVRVLIERRIP